MLSFTGGEHGVDRFAEHRQLIEQKLAQEHKVLHGSLLAEIAKGRPARLAWLKNNALSLATLSLLVYHILTGVR